MRLSRIIFLAVFTAILITPSVVFPRVGPPPEIENPVGGGGTQDRSEEFRVTARVREYNHAEVMNEHRFPYDPQMINGINYRHTGEPEKYYLHVGEQTSLSLRMKNIGFNTWTRADGYKLKATGEQADKWGYNPNHLNLGSSEEIETEENKLFYFPVAAPNFDDFVNPGTGDVEFVLGDYNCNWNMSQNNQAFANTSEDIIEVTNLDYKIILNGLYFHPGMTMYVSEAKSNRYPRALPVDVYVLLEIPGYGFYILVDDAPTFTQAEAVPFRENQDYGIMLNTDYDYLFNIHFPAETQLPNITCSWHVGVFHAGTDLGAEDVLDNFLFYSKTSFYLEEGSSYEGMSGEEFVDLLQNWIPGLGEFPW